MGGEAQAGVTVGGDGDVRRAESTLLAGGVVTGSAPALGKYHLHVWRWLEEKRDERGRFQTSSLDARVDNNNIHSSLLEKRQV